MKSLFSTLACVGLCLSLLPATSLSHCQVPCGIYDDAARISAMLEDAVTVAKAVTKLDELEGKHDTQSTNQKVRWVMNKESHAQKIIETMADYFLTQRVKPSQEDYAERLAKHHAVILAAMKAKQQSSAESAAALTKAIEAISPYYPKHSH